MSSPTVTPPDLHSILLEMGRNGHAVHVILAQEQLDDALQQLLCSYMPNLTEELRKELFGHYAPFSSFRAKIDVAYAMTVIDKTTHADLHIVRKIRNRFAHSKNRMDFDAEEMKTLLKKFNNFNPEMDRLAFFVKKTGDCWRGITPQIKKAAMISLLRGNSDTGE